MLQKKPARTHYRPFSFTVTIILRFCYNHTDTGLYVLWF
uniref:Uncharacterized protein n=1 Tax=Anguilla anguilla TaxID=7936 RepID=A0A0E9S281_ANGAN